MLFDNGSNPIKKAINGGVVEYVGQKKTTKTYAALDLMQFFGFVVINEDTDNSIFESRIMNYDPTIFNTLKETIRTSDSLIAATEVNI